jgi:hypothetical protein
MQQLGEMQRWPALLAAGVGMGDSLRASGRWKPQGQSPKTFQLAERPVQFTEIHSPAKGGPVVCETLMGPKQPCDIGHI